MFRRRILPFLLFLLCLVLGVICLMTMEVRDVVLLLTGAILPRLIIWIVEIFEVPALYGPLAGIGGRWETVWTCEREGGEPDRYPDILRIYRIGATIWGRCRYSNVDRPYVLRGRLVRGGMLSGRWKSAQRGSDYHGVFILQMGEDKGRLNGSWLGTSEHLGTRRGQWRWER